MALGHPHVIFILSNWGPTNVRSTLKAALNCLNQTIFHVKLLLPHDMHVLVTTRISACFVPSVTLQIPNILSPIFFIPNYNEIEVLPFHHKKARWQSVEQHHIPSDVPTHGNLCLLDFLASMAQKHTFKLSITFFGMFIIDPSLHCLVTVSTLSYSCNQLHVVNLYIYI